jgi:erythromycin esterase-like protein
MKPPVVADAVAVVQGAMLPFDTLADDARVVDWIGEAPIVLLGEASHGTQDFYEARARLSRQLIERKGFAAIAVEGDWPDAARVNRYVQGSGGLSAFAALAGFARFPTWMWRNTEIATLVDWMRTHNHGLPAARQVGFYGLDLYSLRASMEAVIAYLDPRDPDAAREARASYACFDRFGGEADHYAWAAGRLGDDTCEDAVVRQLATLQRQQAQLVRGDGADAAAEFFHAEQNARVARNAEHYYRTMMHGHAAAWNIRDEHMAETLAELREFLTRRGQEPKIIVWAHNSHLGDARATQMGDAGERNLGQLARERWGDEVRSIGFTTHSGTVIAASDWGDPPECKRVRPALGGSVEHLFHQAGRSRFFLPIEPGSDVADVLASPRLERAIGVIYRPETERQSHYFHARVAEQFDAIVHLDVTSALIPLEAVQPPPEGEPPETYPEGV